MSDWANLPVVVLSEVYSYLADIDRARMARVCSTWSSEFHNSRLWTNRTIRFGGYYYNDQEFARSIGYARVHGDALKTLSISCEHPSFVLCKRFQRAAASFLSILSWKRAQLREFRMRQLYVERYWRHELLRERLIASFSRFFRSQNELTFFDMTDATLPIGTGLRLLGSLSRRCGASVKQLFLQDFFQLRTAAFRNRSFQEIMQRFAALTIMHLSYSCVCNQLLETLKNNCAQLQQLCIKITKNEPHFHVIDPVVWTQLKRTCRSLAVSMDFEGIGKYEELRRILLREVPLQSLHIWTGLHHIDDVTWRLDDMLRYVGQAYANSLGNTFISYMYWAKGDFSMLLTLNSNQSLSFFFVEVFERDVSKISCPRLLSKSTWEWGYGERSSVKWSQLCWLVLSLQNVYMYV